MPRTFLDSWASLNSILVLVSTRNKWHWHQPFWASRHWLTKSRKPTPLHLLDFYTCVLPKEISSLSFQVFWTRRQTVFNQYLIFPGKIINLQSEKLNLDDKFLPEEISISKTLCHSKNREQCILTERHKTFCD